MDINDSTLQKRLAKIALASAVNYGYHSFELWISLIQANLLMSHPNYGYP